METNEVKQALSARSRTATLEELASQGKRQVRLIKAEHVAAMITAAVHTAIDESGLIPREEADNLVERSRSEFKKIVREREQEARRLHDLEDRLRERDEEIERLQQELEHARAAVQLGGGASPGARTAGAAAAGNGTPQAAGAAPGQPDLSAALEKLAGSLNDRLEQIGRKMGVSSAVEGEEVKFDGLFKDHGPELESNMENIQVKKKAGGGIAANLERLKKLKGGG